MDLTELAMTSATAAGLSETVPSGESSYRARILWAGVDAGIRDGAMRLLGVHYDVAAVSDGGEALARVRTSVPDLVLVDMTGSTPDDLDGLRVLRELRADPSTQAIPVIMVSARTGVQEATDRHESLTDDVLFTPFSALELLARVRTQLALARLRRAAAADQACVIESERLAAESRANLAAEMESRRALLEVIETQRRTEETLRASEARLGLAVAASRVGSWDLNLQTNEVYLSLAWKQQLGFTEGEIPDRFEQWTGRLHPDDSASAMAGVQRLLANPESGLAHEFRMRRKDGAWRWMHGEARILPDAAGRPARMIGCDIDITERKLAEQRLAASEHRLRTIIETEPECVKVLGPNCTLLEMNPAGLAMIEADSLEQVAGLCVLELLLPEHRAAFADLAARVERGESGALEFEIQGLRGGRRWLETRAVPMRDEKGQGVLQLAVTRDVTARRQAEERLLASEERFRSLVHDLQVGIVVHGPQGEVRLCNPTAYTLLGLTEAELLGTSGFGPSSHVVHDDGTPCAAADLPVARVIATLLPVRSVRLGVSRPRGLGPVWLLVDAEPRFTPGGALKEVLVTIGDATARRQAEAERTRLETRLRQSQKMEAIGTLAGGIAHDFNNMLAAILGNVSLALQDVGEGHPARESLDAIVRAGERAKTLVRQILSFSRQEVPEKRVLNLRAAIEEDVRLLRATLPAGVELITEFVGDPPSILADPTQVHQVLLNLCTNAWHAMEDRPGRITVCLGTQAVDRAFADAHPELDPGHHARLSVSDSGKGMDAATIERIFDPFFTTKGVGRGTGLGLSVVHGIMKHHHGLILVESEPEHGTTFTLYFPVTALSTSGGLARRVPSDMLRGQGERILFLDDEAPLVDLATRTLTQLGYRVTGHTSASEALAALGAAPDAFDLVVTDLNMPDASGLDVARALQALRPDLPLVLASGFISSELRSEAGVLGVRQLLDKPFTVDELGECVRRLLNSAPGSKSSLVATQ